MEYALLALRAPSNVEKEVRELQRSLYRQYGLGSALALPVMIPLCFVAPTSVPAKQRELRGRLRRTAGREALRLTAKSIAERDGHLFWDMAPRRELQRLRRRCAREFDSPTGECVDPFPVARGFLLCSLQGKSPAELEFPDVSDTLLFTSGAAFLLRICTLAPESASAGESVSPAGTHNNLAVNIRPWWKSLFWEKLEEIPLRKSGSER